MQKSLDLANTSVRYSMYTAPFRKCAIKHLILRMIPLSWHKVEQILLIQIKTP